MTVLHVVAEVYSAAIILVVLFLVAAAVFGKQAAKRVEQHRQRALDTDWPPVADCCPAHEAIAAEVEARTAR